MNALGWLGNAECCQTEVRHKPVVRLETQPRRAVLPERRLILAFDDRELLQDVGEIVSAQPVEVGVDAVEGGAGRGARFDEEAGRPAVAAGRFAADGAAAGPVE
jgi:hypothetical protein